MAVISKTAILTPAAVDLTISKYKGESSPFTNAIGKGSDNTGNYAEWGLVTGRQAYTKVYWSFDMSSIPSNATITNVTCSARCSNTNENMIQGGNTSIAIGVGETTKVASENASFGKNPTVVTVSDATFTRAELDNFRLKIQAVRGFLGTNTSYHTKFYGATLTIDYTVPSEVTSTTQNIYVGNSKITSIYLGNTSIVKAYLGDILLFGSQTASSNNIHITWMDGNNELDPYSGKINSGVATDICSELISLSPGTYTFSCSKTTHWMGYAIYNYDTEVCEDGNDTGELSITFTLTENKKVRLGANVEECERTAFSLIREPTGGAVSSNLWDGVSYLPGRVDDNPTWGEYTGTYTDNWSLIDPYGIQYDITASSMRGFTLQFENLTSGKYLNFTAISNQEVYRYPEADFYFFDSSKTYLSKVRTGISSDGISQEVILTNGEMFASVLIPDNATCCEMTFKLTIDTPTPYHIEITNINVMEDDSSLY